MDFNLQDARDNNIGVYSCKFSVNPTFVRIFKKYNQVVIFIYIRLPPLFIPMENSENKSLISPGSSNLAKTEKLLSITQKILSEIKPQYESVRIGNQEWMTRNLDVDRFRNGDLIPNVKSAEDWKKAGENGQPVWCYYDNDPENGKKYGKLYNWFAVNDPRGLSPEGWHVPSDDEWTILADFLRFEFSGLKMKSVEGWEDWEDEDGEFQNGNGDNSSGFNALPGGGRCNWGTFGSVRHFADFWSATENDNFGACLSTLYKRYSFVAIGFTSKKCGSSVRCLKDSIDSKWLQAVKSGTIKPYKPPGIKLK